MKIIKRAVKRLLHDQNDCNFIKVGDQYLSQHDQDHLAIAALPRIQMGAYMVSGIHGVNIPEFHAEPITEEYSGYYDECRVGIHQLMVRPSVLAVLRYGHYFIWMLRKGINPIAVTTRHIASM